MKKDTKVTENQKTFKISHQTLCITAFNFDSQCLIGYVELQLHPLRPDLRRVKINSKQCCIYRVCVNDHWEATFQYNDPTLEICQGDVKQRNLDYYESCHYKAMTAVDSSCGNGELTIKLPTESFSTIADLKPIRVTIEFSLENPKGGIKFVVPDLDGTMLDRGAHLFTYGHENSARLWFPCLDSYSEVCTWKLEFTVDMYMTAISCGDLIETVYTPDLRKKTYHYFLSIPTAAPNIALAVGPFEVLVDPHMHEVTHFCLPHLMPLLKHSTAFLHEAFEFYEELMSSRYPYSCYKQVFVDQAFHDASPYATMTIFSTNLLHAPKIIDQTLVSRRTMAHAVAQQFFGCFMSMNSWCDAWLPKGISGYLAILFLRKAFGNNEYRHFIAKELKAVQQYEHELGPIVMDPSNVKESPMYFPIKHPHTVSSKYAELYAKKAHLILRMLEIRIGRELLLQALNKLLALATNASQQKFQSNTWPNMLLSTSAFLKGISTVTGKDITVFIDQWVREGGCARFYGQFVFNRKRNVVELELKQDFGGKGVLKYVGPLTVTIQELDGSFNHTFKIEENKYKFEITCHSKSRRNKKKKIPLMTGEEVDMDLSAMDADSPVLWLRVDPDMTILRQVVWEQPDYMWQYQLRYERDVVAQREAIMALENYPTPATRLALTDTIENEHCFYRVRMEAAMCLSKVANAMVANWAGPPAMMTIFRKMFGSHSCQAIVRQNNFTNFQQYFLQKTIPVAMACLRNIHCICPPEVLKFLLDLFKYNDNSKNKFSDNYYRAALIDALACTITPAVTTVTVNGNLPSTDFLSADTKLILEEITRALNLEKLLPCYRHTVTVSCLQAIRVLQKYGHLPSDPSIFKSYAAHGNFVDVRLAALDALVDFVKVESSREELYWLLRMVEEDPEPFVRHKIMQMFMDTSPFRKGEDSILNTEDLVERLWKNMKLRCDIVDQYYVLYGRTRPKCLPIPESVMVLNLKERRTKLSASMMPEPEHSSPASSPEPPPPAQPLPHSPQQTQKVDLTLGIPCSPRLEHGLGLIEEEIMAEPMDLAHSPDMRKRHADSPLPPMNEPFHSSIDPNIKAEPSTEDPFKYKVKFGDSTDLDDGELSVTSPAHLDKPPTPGDPSSQSASSYADDFLKFAGVQSPRTPPENTDGPPMLQPDAMLVQESTFKLVQESTFKLGQESTFKLGQESSTFKLGPESTFKLEPASRLSEDSNSPPRAVSQSPPHMTDKLTPPPPLPPPSLPAFESTLYSAKAASASPSTPADESASSGKHHKAKKKKKKNKHKHKHKHKHDKHDRERGERPSLAGSMSTEPCSSGTSNVNSPATHNMPSSPEFEVI